MELDQGVRESVGTKTWRTTGFLGYWKEVLRGKNGEPTPEEDPEKRRGAEDPDGKREVLLHVGGVGLSRRKRGTRFDEEKGRENRYTWKDVVVGDIGWPKAYFRINSGNPNIRNR